MPDQKQSSQSSLEQGVDATRVRLTKKIVNDVDVLPSIAGEEKPDVSGKVDTKAAPSLGSTLGPRNLPQTYATFLDWLQHENRLGGSFAIGKSALKSFLQTYEKTFADPIGDEFNENFVANLDKHIKECGLPARQSSSRKCLLKRIQRHLKDSLAATAVTSPLDFGEALTYHMGRKGWRVLPLAQKVPMAETTLHYWKHGIKWPSPSSIGLVTRIEAILQIPPATLTKLVFQGPNEGTRKTGLSPFGQKQQINTLDHYRLTEQKWPAHLQEEMRAFVDDKKRPVTSPDCRRSPEAGYRTDKPKSGTESFDKNLLASFFGFLVNKRPNWKAAAIEKELRKKQGML